MTAAAGSRSTMTPGLLGPVPVTGGRRLRAWEGGVRLPAAQRALALEGKEGVRTGQECLLPEQGQDEEKEFR